MKKIKAFTLVELIVVIAVLSILMVGIMNMFRPIRAVYVDSTLYEGQRTTQNGMVQYVTESTRYATNLSLDNKSANMLTAINEFSKGLEWVNGQQRRIEVVYVDNKTDNVYNGRIYHGRLYRASAMVTAHVSTSTTFSVKDLKGTAMTDSSVGKLALGSAYYGPYTYSISLSHATANAGVPSEASMKITVSSLVTTSIAKQNAATTNNISAGEHVLTEGDVSLLNLSSTVKDSGKYDVTNYDGNSTTMNKITYIVYTTDKK